MPYKFEDRQVIMDWCKENLSREERFSIAKAKAPEDKKLRPVWIFNADRQPIGHYQTMGSAARALGITYPCTISNYIQRKMIYKKRYFFSFTETLPEDFRSTRKPYGIQ